MRSAKPNGDGAAAVNAHEVTTLRRARRSGCVRKNELFSTTYWIRRDNKPYKGSYPTLSAAVEAAEKEP